MTRRFALDENVWVFACRGLNERNVRDNSSVRLIGLIVKNHHAIAFNDELYRKTMRKLSAWTSKKSPNGLRVMRLLNSLKNEDETFLFWQGEDDTDYDETEIPRKDRFIVRLAVGTSSVLVTADGSVLGAVARVIPALIARRPEQAIPLAQET
ncbi:MAG: hypothetical protein HYU30_03815 [Chloroflexi bacterium]|nr:hypothetical protein [Chloroflexota bacterium]